MKSTWIPLVLTRSTSSLVDGEREAVAERDVAGGVLVEQRVVEDRAERPDPALPVDERELAEADAPSSIAMRARSAPPFSSASTSTAGRPRTARAGRGRSCRP